MKAKSVLLYGKNDLRLEEYELPAIKSDEILTRVVSDSICMSSYKAAKQGAAHKRVPNDVATTPIIIGHEFCGEIVEVGEKWKSQFRPGQRFTIQTALNYKGTLDSPGYSYRYCGGASTYAIMPQEVMLLGCLLTFEGEAFFHGSLAEPMSCIVGAFHASYHTKAGSYQHQMGIVEGGKCAILAGAGPMGLGAIDYAMNCDRRPSLLVVTDIDEARLARARSVYTVEMAKERGVKLVYLNTGGMSDAESDAAVLAETQGTGYDDVFVFAPVKPVVEQGDRILGRDGCLNFFAGPTDPNFSAMFNFYNVHYASTHVVGTSGGNTDDLRESIAMMADGRINPVGMITHIGGLDSCADATLNLVSIPGGKKLIYTGISMPLTAIDHFAELGADNPMFARLAEITVRHNGLWSPEAEQYLLSNAQKL